MLQRVTTNVNGTIKHNQMAGRDYLVVPMVMLTVGVHAGSNGPLFYPEDELGKLTAAWNNKPVVVYHPTDASGNGISACDPDVLTARQVGVIMNTKYKKGKLHAEAWLEADRVEKIDKRILEALESDEMMELSTGLFTENEETAGEWKGEAYTSIARNYRPDHLAILPDKKGACSIEDGAGLLRTNAKSFDNVRRDLYDALRARYPAPALPGVPYDSPWIEDVYKDFFIFSHKGKLLKLGYEMDKKTEKTSISADAPVPVIRVTEYRTADGGAFVGNVDTAEKEKTTMARKEQVDALIANGTWTEADREFLTGLPEDRFARLAPAPTANAKPTPAVLPPVVPAQAAVAAPLTANAGAVVPPPAKPLTWNELFAQADPAVQEGLREMADVTAATKGQLIASITGNANNPYTADELKVMSVGALRKLAQISGANAGTVTANGQAGVPIFMGAALPSGVPAAPKLTTPPLVMPTMNFGTAK